MTEQKAEILESLVNHLTLPAKLPGQQDARLAKIESLMISFLSRATRKLNSNNVHENSLDNLLCSLVICKAANTGGRLQTSSLLTILQELRVGEFIILHIAAQNAALIIRRDHLEGSRTVLFEAFEASPLSEEVLASQGALRWDFPGSAVAIPIVNFEDAAFQDELATFLEKASTESVKRFAARTNKAGSFAFESRDSVDPSLITQMLMTLLEVNGTRTSPPILRKRVHDDVCWEIGDPWRRAPLWLVLRVAIHRHLATIFGGEVGRLRYKLIICLVLADILDEAVGALNLESLVHVKAKLCRRLVKLEMERARASGNLRIEYDSMLKMLQPIFNKSTAVASQYIANDWEMFKRSTQRPVLTLPSRAERRDLRLTLPNSGDYIQEALWLYSHRRDKFYSTSPYKLPQNYDLSTAVKKSSTAFVNRYFRLAIAEHKIENFAPVGWAVMDSEGMCTEIAEKINDYLTTTAGAYDFSPEQKSIMLLSVMELWVSLDNYAASLFPLLKDYSSGFLPAILDVLQLSRLSDMCRLQKIRSHLQKRIIDCGASHKTIFDDPGKGCFAERYYDESSDCFSLASLHQDIEISAKEARSLKEKEWREKSESYEKLGKSIVDSACLYIVNEFQVKTHADHQCKKCFLEREQRRIRIRVHEHPLPADPIQAKTVVFELNCPQAFNTYRTTTWRIMGALALPKLVNGHSPHVVLREYSELRDFSYPIMAQFNTQFTLASTTKSFLRTHYANPTFPLSLEDIILPNGLKLKYFDTSLKAWPGQQFLNITFAHHFQIAIPTNSPFSSLNSSPNFIVGEHGPSSYQIIASQTKCPSGLNSHEFMAFQTLFSGKSRRWPQILIELAASSLNFGTEATTVLMSLLALQLGPSHKSDPLGLIHRSFKDQSFCHRLAEQLGQRLDAISSNYRETNCMETIMTLMLRLVALGVEVSSEPANLLEKARTIAFKWLTVLRSEIQTATDAEVSQRCARYAFWAALLCRRTFAVHADSKKLLEPDALKCFIGCAITLQDNLVGDPAAWPILLRNAFVRDLKMVYRMRSVLRKSLSEHPECLMLSIDTIWPGAKGATARTFSGFKFVDKPNEWWVKVTIDATPETEQQQIHFNLMEGHLLVAGKPVGKLPAEYSSSTTLRQLFGDQSLLIYPSPLAGMTYMLAIAMNGHQIHLAFPNSTLVVRACLRNTILELIPPEKFGNSQNFDLPDSLVTNCVHWLDLRTGKIEIRQRPDIWKSKPSNWILDFPNRSAKRRSVRLVDPHSALFSKVAQVFHKFEYRHQLTVYQPSGKPLTVGLQRLELSFFVNERYLLESSQLQAEITLDQDAGCLYGLNSKILLREVTRHRNPYTQQFASEPGRRRSIIVPMGDLTHKRSGPHVIIDISNTGEYGRYTINEVLKRLDCPAEPWLLYLKAQLHAYTSFILPDPLTGRTGTEEAIHCLQSGYSQPWTPLVALGPQKCLQALAKLTPRRDYYPKDLKVMQNTQWNRELTISIQDDSFRAIVEDIRTKSEVLSIFAAQSVDFPAFESEGVRHLTLRSQLKRNAYLPKLAGGVEHQALLDLEYIGRDLCRASIGRSNVIESTSLIRDWSPRIFLPLDLATALQKWANIGGYSCSFDKMLLTDLLDVQFDAQWGSLVTLCRLSNPADTYRLMFLFGLISFRQDADMDIVRTLIAFAVLSDLKTFQPPVWPVYNQFRNNQVPRLDYLLQLMKPYFIPYDVNDIAALGFTLSSKMRKRVESLELAHEQQQERDAKAFGEFLLKQWPCYEPRTDGFIPGSMSLDISGIIDIICPEWLRLFQNWELSQHIGQVQLVLNRHHVEEKFAPPAFVAGEQEVLPTRIRGGEVPILRDLLLRKCILDPHVSSLIKKPVSKVANLQGSKSDHLVYSHRHRTSGSSNHNVSPLAQEVAALCTIIGTLIKSNSTVRQQYGTDLKRSLDALCSLKDTQIRIETGDINQGQLLEAITIARCEVQDKFDVLLKSFQNGDARVPWLLQGGLWPHITPVALLENLRSVSSCVFGDGMKESLISYALSLTALQRLIRLQDAHQKFHHQKVVEELENIGHHNWKPQEYTDWLLLEIDSNMLIRPTQFIVAQATISPVSGSNSVLQMNMGQGKTSCIIPMAAAFLADGENLHRVIIPKSLLLQTAQLLHARLGGLLGRTICHIPFSRKTPTNADTIETFYRIHKEIRASHGVMLSLPEHLLSFTLSGMQRLSDGKVKEAKTMIRVQDWLKRKSRDVLDECDSILAIRTQLIYPSGSQKTVDGHPYRWTIVESMLSRVDGHLWDLQKGYPHSIEVIRRPQGGFPIIFFLRKDVEDQLMARLVDDIYHGQMAILPLDCTKADLLAIKEFISEAKVSENAAVLIRQLHPDKPAFKQLIHLLRGLFVHRILLMTLKKRWNVQYGLHPDRDPIAVPYMSKGTPSDQAEWGHPDVAILFTCLAFYYDGLTTAQLRQTLEHVLKSDDPSQDYDRFSQDSKLPDSLREWNSVNVDDEVQLKEIWHHVRYKVAAIDYFLNSFVFPKHAKQFHVKLQASGWDIPLNSSLADLPQTDQSGKSSHSLTTGFSGTNDWKRMLPLTITQQDLSTLAHTNAEVLTYLLQPRNLKCVVAEDSDGRHVSELDLLRSITRMRIRILIDAGAQILEMTNFAVAKAWLEIYNTSRSPAPAAVYFDEKNRPFVLYRHGHRIPLLASPYADNLGDCLVYLDEAHTRGTDLKFPANARGALTLGLGQTKDHTVQAAMRLRQLGSTQSVTFFVPPEVQQSILDVCQKHAGTQISSYHVICWLLEQTCNGIEQLQPLYFSQGADFCRRMQAALDNRNFLGDSEQRKAYLNSLRQVEQQTLEQLYGLNKKMKPPTPIQTQYAEIATFMKQLKLRRKGFQDDGNAVHGSALQEVEQEREVAYELEAVREVQRPVHYQPHVYPGLHKDVVSFAKTGRLPAGFTTCVEAFVALDKITSLGRKYAINSNATSDRVPDQFQRPVNWILWSTVTHIALIVVPEEAEQLIIILSDAEDLTTHLLTYAAPVTRKMIHFDDLRYYSIPSLPSYWKAPMWLRVELGIFAGRLYFDYSEYSCLLGLLGISGHSSKLEEEDGEGDVLAVDGNNEVGTVTGEIIEINGKASILTAKHDVIIEGIVEITGEAIKFSKAKDSEVLTPKPLGFLQEWLAIRRKGQEFTQTPMGFLCQGKPLSESHPFFVKQQNGGENKILSDVRGFGVESLGLESEEEAEHDFCDDTYGEDIEGDEGKTFDDTDLNEENDDNEAGVIAGFR